MGYTVGDTAPNLTGRCTYKESATGPELPVNLTGATVELHVQQPDRVVLTIPATGNADGSWSAPWPAPIAQSGAHDVEVQVTFSGGGIQTFGPSRFHVQRQIA